MTSPLETPLHVEDRGTGDPVLLLHSGGMSSRQWKSLTETLASTYRTVAPDFLGSGKNPPWPDDAPFHFGLDVEAIARVLKTLGAPAHLVGHSYGGLVALTLARSYPALVRSVAVYDPVAFGVLYEPRDEEGLADLGNADSNPIMMDDARAGTEEWMEAFVGYWNGPGAWKALPQPSRDQFLRVAKKVSREVLTLLRDRTPASAYRSLAMPALFLSGERSPAAARRTSDILAKAFTKATLHTVAGAGHMGPMTHAAVVNEAIAAHLARA